MWTSNKALDKKKHQKEINGGGEETEGPEPEEEVDKKKKQVKNAIGSAQLSDKSIADLRQRLKTGYAP